MQMIPRTEGAEVVIVPVPTSNDLESLQRIHVRLQRAGTHPAVQGHSEARPVSSGALLAVLLKQQRRSPLRSQVAAMIGNAPNSCQAGVSNDVRECYSQVDTI